MKAHLKLVGLFVLGLSHLVAQEHGPNSTAVGSESRGSPAEAENQYVAFGEPIEMVAVRYPKPALKEHIEGNVVLRASVSKQGQVRNVSALSGDHDLAHAATDAIKHWVFLPYLQNDRPTEAFTKVTVVFRIDDNGSPAVSVMYDAPKPPLDDPVFKPGEITLPKVLYAPDPYYGDSLTMALTGSIRGAVEISLVVLPNGTTDSVKVTKGLRPDLDVKAVEVVRHWRFKPATTDGKAVAASIRVTLDMMY